jgi:hypothetical protein
LIVVSLRTFRKIQERKSLCGSTAHKVATAAPPPRDMENKNMSKVSQEERAIQDRARAARFASNGEPKEAVGFDKGEPSDSMTAERSALLSKGKGNVSNLSGAFDDVDAAVRSFKSADSGTRS